MSATTGTTFPQNSAQLVVDRFEAARTVADGSYEGYVLYPYRASSRKNQVRFQWGVLTPRSHSEADGSERWSARTDASSNRATDATSQFSGYVFGAYRPNAARSKPD